VTALFAELRRADAEATLLETGLVPQTRQSLEASRAGYEVDKVDFLSLIDSQVSLLGAELRLVRARADRRGAFAGLEAALGEGLR
jgi:outer membrane protein TolC